MWDAPQTFTQCFHQKKLCITCTTSKIFVYHLCLTKKNILIHLCITKIVPKIERRIWSRKFFSSQAGSDTFFLFGDPGRKGRLAGIFFILEVFYGSCKGSFPVLYVQQPTPFQRLARFLARREGLGQNIFVPKIDQKSAKMLFC